MNNQILLRFNSRIKEFHKAKASIIIKEFQKVYEENDLLALKYMFYLGDVRQGLGERRIFRFILKYLSTQKPDMLKPLLKQVPEYTRWDNLWCLLDSPLKNEVLNIVRNQLKKDIILAKQNKKVSLLAKWMPSINTSSDKTKRIARIIAKSLTFSHSKYRKILSFLRERLDIVERKMSNKEWLKINIKTIPNKAKIIYQEAFLRHRIRFFNKVNKVEKDKRNLLAILNSDRYKPIWRSNNIK